MIYSREKIIIKKGKVHNNHIKIKHKDQTRRQTTENIKTTTTTSGTLGNGAKKVEKKKILT